MSRDAPAGPAAELAALARAAGGPIVVTGASGFIGSHLVVCLAGAGARLHCMTSSGSRGEAAGATAAWFRADLADPASADAAVGAGATVFHLAGMNALDYADAHPGAAFRANILCAANVLEAARRAGARRVVLVSTAHVYARPWRLPVDEAHPVAPASIYGASKLAADVLALGYWRAYGLPVTVLRLFNVYGPGQTAPTAISTLVRQAVGGEPLRLRDPTVERDFVYVADAVDALIAAALSPQAVGEEIVVAGGRAVALGEIARIVAALAGRRDVAFAPTTTAAEASAAAAAAATTPAMRSATVPAAPDRLFGNAAKAQALVGWTPRTPLRDGLAATVDWWRSRTPARAAASANS